MYLDLHKVPTFVMLGKGTIDDVEEAKKNDVGDDDMDLYRLN